MKKVYILSYISKQLFYPHNAGCFFYKAAIFFIFTQFKKIILCNKTIFKNIYKVKSYFYAINLMKRT
jgi:hypothetical protein